MAVLLLWEVGHGRPFPTRGGGERSAVLLGFTRRLRARVGADEELRQWMVCQDVQQPLAPGLADTHHFRWSVRIVPPAPAEPQGWYVEFTTRWRAFLGTQAPGARVGPSPSVGAAQSQLTASPSTSPTAPSSVASRHQRRQLDLRVFIRPRASSAPATASSVSPPLASSASSSSVAPPPPEACRPVPTHGHGRADAGPRT